MKLNDRDMRLYRALKAEAAQGVECSSTEEMMQFLGCESTSTPAVILERMERAGLIRVQRFQRHRVITIIETGQSTAAPKKVHAHWRSRPLGTLNAALRFADAVHPGAEDQLKVLAAERGEDISRVMAEVIGRGLRSIQLAGKGGA